MAKKISRAELEILSGAIKGVKDKIKEITQKDAAAGALAAEVLPVLLPAEQVLTSIAEDPENVA